MLLVLLLCTSVARGEDAPASKNKEIATGVWMPTISIGIWRKHAHLSGSEIAEGIVSWLNSGVNAIDVAHGSSNQPDVAFAINKSGLDRGKIFVASRIPTCMGQATATQLIQQNLNTLRTDYLDLMLVHAPYPDQFCPGTWKALEQFYTSGRLKSIGVSNFKKHQLASLMKNAKVKPAVNQVHFNMYSYSEATEAFCVEHNITIKAWLPLGEGAIMDHAISSDPVVVDVAEAHGVSAVQVALRWVIQRGHALTLLAGGPPLGDADLDVFGFSLTGDDVLRLDKLKKRDSARVGAVVV